MPRRQISSAARRKALSLAGTKGSFLFGAQSPQSWCFSAGFVATISGDWSRLTGSLGVRPSSGGPHCCDRPRPLFPVGARGEAHAFPVRYKRLLLPCTKFNKATGRCSRKWRKGCTIVACPFCTRLRASDLTSCLIRLCSPQHLVHSKRPAQTGL